MTRIIATANTTMQDTKIVARVSRCPGLANTFYVICIKSNEYNTIVTRRFVTGEHWACAAMLTDMRGIYGA